MNLSAFGLMTALIAACSSCSSGSHKGLVFVKGGAFVNKGSCFYGKKITVKDFYIGRYEVTQKEWRETMGSDPSKFSGEDLPVESVSWYDCIEYCNKRSLKEGFTPYYQIDRKHIDPDNTNELDDLKWIIKINEEANGYRLPTEMEWEYAAGGGQASQGNPYSGSRHPDEAAWYWKNSGDRYLNGNWSWNNLVSNNNRPHPVGTKRPNELGLFDMSGNVREWCWDWNVPAGAGEAPGRVWKGGGWMGADFCCEPAFKAVYAPNGKGPDQGFRICRSNLSAGKWVNQQKVLQSGK